MSIKYVIVDIDGTVADLSHRIHFIEGEKKDWDSFYNNVEKDKPIQHVIDEVYCSCRANDFLL